METDLPRKRKGSIPKLNPKFRAAFEKILGRSNASSSSQGADANVSSCPQGDPCERGDAKSGADRTSNSKFYVGLTDSSDDKEGCQQGVAGLTKSQSEPTSGPVTSHSSSTSSESHACAELEADLTGKPSEGSDSACNIPSSAASASPSVGASLASVDDTDSVFISEPPNSAVLVTELSALDTRHALHDSTHKNKTACSDNPPTADSKENLVSNVRKTRLMFEGNADKATETLSGSLGDKNVSVLRPRRSHTVKRIETMDCKYNSAYRFFNAGQVQPENVDKLTSGKGRDPKAGVSKDTDNTSSSSVNYESHDNTTSESNHQSPQDPDKLLLAIDNSQDNAATKHSTPDGDMATKHGTTPVKAKPLILRPKPTLPSKVRATVLSFTTEDLDICQRKSSSTGEDVSRVSRRDGPIRRDLLEAKRRSRSLSHMQRATALSPFSKPQVPSKPLGLTQTKGIVKSNAGTKGTTDRRSRSLSPKERLEELPKPPAKIGSLDDLNNNPYDTILVDSTLYESVCDTQHKQGQEVKGKVNISKPCDTKFKDTNNHSDTKVKSQDELDGGNDSKVKDKRNDLCDSKLKDNDSDICDSYIKTKELCDTQVEGSLSSNNTSKIDSMTENCKPEDKTTASTFPVKMPRTKSKLKKSFRKRVYEDVALKDDIPEDTPAKEEELEFSVTDEEDNDDWSDSFTDEDDTTLSFVQQQADMAIYANAATREKPLSEISENSSDSPAEEPQDKLYKIANEILTTEQAYLLRLHLIDQIFHFKVITENRSQKFLSEDVIPQIFLNIKSIYQFHDFLLKELEKRMAQWSEIQRIGDIMMRWAPFLKLYTEYINQFDSAMTMFSSCFKSNNTFANIVNEIQKMPECGSLSLQHHMLEPIQRLPRYELLLKDYLKHLPEDSQDTQDTQKALDLVTKAAAHANETIRKTEKSAKLLTLTDRIIGASSLDLINPTRELIKEGPITKISARDGSHLVRYLFLFNDILLVCVPVTLSRLGILKHQFKVKIKLDIEGMRVMEGDDLYTPNTFQVKSKTKSVEFHTSSAEEKDEWHTMLWNVIADFTKRKMSRRVGPSLAENFQEDELGKRAPTWIRDQAASMCMLCAREFTTFFRRHHCRACGQVVCGNCSARKTQLAYDNHKYNRVCDNCYNILELKLQPSAIMSRGAQKKSKSLQCVKAQEVSLMSGYLHMSQNKKTWEKRFFAVRDNFVLYSFKAHQDLYATTSLPLPGYVVSQVKESQQSQGKSVFKLFHIGLKKEYYFQADDAKVLTSWLNVLEKVVRAELPEDTQPDDDENTA